MAHHNDQLTKQLQVCFKVLSQEDAGIKKLQKDLEH